MNVLVTSSRMPFALDEIRKFGRAGHRVFAADTFDAAPGGHSRHVIGRLQVSAPAEDPERFVDEVRQIVAALAIDLIVPCFEEVFYLARHPAGLPLFAPGFELLARLHNKARFHELATSLGLPAPSTVEVTSADALQAAVAEHARWVARPSWSRGSFEIATNAGPLAGALPVADCHPSPARPWIVQEYVDGVDVCTFSVAQHGRVVAHCSYVHPLEIDHGGGIVFESVDAPQALAIVERMVAATGYHGQIGMDFRQHDGQVLLLECNPRPTAGVHLLSDRLLVDAVLRQPNGKPAVVGAGLRRKYSSAIVRDLILHLGHLRGDLALLLSSQAPDVYAERGDRLPALYQLVSYANVLAWRLRHRSNGVRRGHSLVAAYFDGISWNGEAIP